MLPPPLWQVVCGPAWLALPPAKSWVLWRAILRAQWTTAVAWRETFISLSRDYGGVQPDSHVVDGLRELVELPTLIALLESLMREKTLLRHDGVAIEEMLFARAAADGQWTRPKVSRKL
jgi:hypothetical protein